MTEGLEGEREGGEKAGWNVGKGGEEARGEGNQRLVVLSRGGFGFRRLPQ